VSIWNEFPTFWRLSGNSLHIDMTDCLRKINCIINIVYIASNDRKVMNDEVYLNDNSSRICTHCTSLSVF
jgi:hypothetical protein